MRRRALLSGGDIDYSDCFAMVVTTGGDITWTGSITDNTLSYSKDNGTTWTTANSGTAISVAAGDKVLWKGTPTPQSSGGIGKFSGATKTRYSVEGNVMSLLYGDNFKGQTSLTGKNYALYRLFGNNTNVTSAENLSLPATTLTQSCYRQMFNGCTRLTTAPELPATTLTQSCYRQMFNGCTRLNSITCYAINIGDIECTTDWVNGVAASGTFVGNKYAGWAINSTSGVPTNWTATYVDVQETTFNPTKSLSPSGYVTLTANGDSLLGLSKKSNYHTVYISKNRSKWQAINVDEYFKMSNGDIYYVCGLLSNNNSDSNYTQFTIKGSVNSSGNCSAIWSYSNLNASLKNYCGYKMFSGCDGLTTAPELPATKLETYCYDCMFLCCTSLTTAPELPATTLEYMCYANMFKGCTSLTIAPELPATTLAIYCYFHMFYGCKNLNYIKAMFTTTPSATYTSDWVYNVASSGTFVKNSSATWNVTGNNGIPSGWTVQNS